MISPPLRSGEPDLSPREDVFAGVYTTLTKDSASSKVS